MSGINVARSGRRRGNLDGPTDDRPRLATTYTLDQIAWLKSQADKRGINVSSMVRMCIQANVDRANRRAEGAVQTA